MDSHGFGRKRTAMTYLALCWCLLLLLDNSVSATGSYYVNRRGVQKNMKLLSLLRNSPGLSSRSKLGSLIKLLRTGLQESGGGDSGFGGSLQNSAQDKQQALLSFDLALKPLAERYKDRYNREKARQMLMNRG